MSRTSTVKRLPKQVRDLIEELRGNGRTIAEILAKLAELDISIAQSTLGRWTRQLDAIAEEASRRKFLAEALVERFGDRPETAAARLNIELMHGLMMKSLIGEDGQPAILTPQEAAFLGTAIQRLASASKLDVDRTLKLQQAERAAAAERAVKAATEAGLSAAQVALLRREVLGVRPTQEPGDAAAIG
jgi:hypothetical protein